MGWQELTRPLVSGMPVAPGDAPVLVERTMSIEGGDMANLTRFSASAHAGTHVDAPAHFVAGGAGIEALPLDALVGPALLVDARYLGAELGDPSLETLRSLVEGYAHAIETNNRELALRYVHPRSPRKSEIDATLREQLASYLERARTSDLERLRLPDGTIYAKVDQEFVRIVGMKFTRGARSSIFHFRELSGSWRIWGIDEVAPP